MILAGASLTPQSRDGHLILHSMLEPPPLTPEGSLTEVGLAGRTMAHPTLGHDGFSIWRRQPKPFRFLRLGMNYGVPPRGLAQIDSLVTVASTFWDTES